MAWLCLGVVALAVVSAVVVLTRFGSAGAARPLDGHSTSPNDPSEVAGSGYLLTDPTQSGAKFYWAGAYNTFVGLKSYCIDQRYDYPRAGYGYTFKEVWSWPGRPIVGGGAAGHVAQRIVWIMNTYGQAPSAATNAAVSMAVNLLNASPAFTDAYTRYFRPQLDAISPAIVRQVGQLLADSDAFAGPFATRVTFGPAPAVGAVGEFRVSVRSARGTAVRNARFSVTGMSGIRLLSAASGSTGPSGVAVLRYTAPRAAAVSARAVGTSVPNTTVRLGYSPSHNGGNFSSGSQRVLFVSARPTTAATAGLGQVTVRPPQVSTAVVGGTGPRTVGTPVSDRVTASGLLARSGYVVTATLQDATGTVCGSTSSKGVSDGVGQLVLDTPPVAACGGGADTFAERLADSAGRIVATTPPGQPSETFPVKPTVSTVVVGGSIARGVGDRVADRVHATGLLPNTQYALSAALQDAGGTVCGSTTGPVRTDRGGNLAVDTAEVTVCGGGRNTFIERITDSSGSTVASTPPDQPAETFPVAPAVTTTVVGGIGPRSIGSPVSDRVVAVGLALKSEYRLQVTLQDDRRAVCGTTEIGVTSDRLGRFTVQTPAILACGTGADTFSERLMDVRATVVASTPPGQPQETFPVLPVQPPAPAKPATPAGVPTAVSPRPVPAAPVATQHPAAVSVGKGAVVVASPAPEMLAVTGPSLHAALLLALALIGAGAFTARAGVRLR